MVSASDVPADTNILDALGHLKGYYSSHSVIISILFPLTAVVQTVVLTHLDGLTMHLT